MQNLPKPEVGRISNLPLQKKVLGGQAALQEENTRINGHDMGGDAKIMGKLPNQQF